MTTEAQSLSELIAKLEQQAANLAEIHKRHEARLDTGGWDAIFEKVRELPDDDPQRLPLQLLAAESRNSALAAQTMNVVLERLVNLELTVAYLAKRLQQLGGPAMG